MTVGGGRVTSRAASDPDITSIVNQIASNKRVLDALRPPTTTRMDTDHRSEATPGKTLGIALPNCCLTSQLSVFGSLSWSGRSSWIALVLSNEIAMVWERTHQRKASLMSQHCRSGIRYGVIRKRTRGSHCPSTFNSRRNWTFILNSVILCLSVVDH